MALDLLVDNIVNELALHNKFGSEGLEPLYFFWINNRSRLDVGGDVFKIVLALAPVPDPVFGKGPGIYFVEERVQLCHIFLLRTVAKYLPLLNFSLINQDIRQFVSQRPVICLNVSPVFLHQFVWG
jgi:hypothetical protein